MIPIVQVDSLAKFKMQVEKYIGVVFRGQTHDYPTLTPTLFRSPQALETSHLIEPSYDLYLDAYAAVTSDPGWGPFSNLNEYHGLAWLRAVGDPAPPDACALLQHYGVPTGALDVSYDPYIALWFASHRFCRSSPLRKGYYIRNPNTGVVYVLRSPKEQLIDLRQGRETIGFDGLPIADLRSEVLIAGLRGKRQQGGLLLGASAERPDLSHLLIGKILFFPSVFNSAPMAHLSQDYLFPSPSSDVFYRALLEGKNSPIKERRELSAFIVEYEPAL